MSKCFSLVKLLGTYGGSFDTHTKEGRMLACALLLCDIGKAPYVSTACMDSLVHHSRMYLKHISQREEYPEHKIDYEAEWENYARIMAGIVERWGAVHQVKV